MPWSDSVIGGFLPRALTCRLRIFEGQLSDDGASSWTQVAQSVGTRQADRE